MEYGEASGRERSGAASEGVPLLSAGVLDPDRGLAVRASLGGEGDVAGDDADLVGVGPGGPPTLAGTVSGRCWSRCCRWGRWRGGRLSGPGGS